MYRYGFRFISFIFIIVGKELVIVLFVCVVGKCFVVLYIFSFPPGVYVGTLNLIASINSFKPGVPFMGHRQTE